MLQSFKNDWFLVVIGCAFLSYSFSHSFWDRPDLISAVDSLPHLISVLAAFYASRRVNEAECFFWTMLSWGTVCYFIAQFIWLYYAGIAGINAPHLGMTDFFRNLQNVLFIVGLCGLLSDNPVMIGCDYLVNPSGSFFPRHDSESVQKDPVLGQDMESGLEHALERQELFLLYQPQFGANDKVPIGVEALLRWKRTEGVIIFPSAFLPLAEENGLIIPIGDWVLREACRQAVAWREKGYSECCMSVNISMKQLMQRDYAQKVKGVLMETGMNPKRLVLEINESMGQAGYASGMLQRLKALGIRIAVDDFGAGYSSLACLRDFKADTLKIAQSFTREISEKPERLDIVKAIQAMARSLRLTVVVEGVENKEAYDLLKEIPFGSGQGYYYSYPVTAEELENRYFIKGG